MLSFRYRSVYTEDVAMAIYQTATYRVKPQAVDKVKRAIEQFVAYVKANEPGTRMYVAWQQQDDPTRFIHLFIFEDAAAQTRHSESEDVKRFESVYSPELIGGDVVFTDFNLIATNQ
jgi:quinol monooxygenase YgiN